MKPFLCAKINWLLQEVIYSPVFFKTGTRVYIHKCSGLVPAELYKVQGMIFMGPKALSKEKEARGCFTWIVSLKREWKITALLVLRAQPILFSQFWLDLK